MEKLLMSAIKESFLTKKDHKIFKKGNFDQRSNWVFDFRQSLGNSSYMDIFTDIFYERYKDKYPFQVCGLETSAILLVGAIIQKFHTKGKPLNGFYVRKSRKKYGLLNCIEGRLDENRIILVDDIVNSGQSIVKVKESLGEVDRKIDEVFCLLRFKNDQDILTVEREVNVRIESIFTLDEIKSELDFESLITPINDINLVLNPLKLLWVNKTASPNYFYVAPKSFPTYHKNHIYFGRDDGNFVCVSETGTIVWSYKVPFGSKGKSIFSTPKIFKDSVVFGAYDGNLYCLDYLTGKLLWVNFDAEWIGSSPDVSFKHNSVIIGTEYGFWREKGGLISVDICTGKLNWVFRKMPDYTHGSPLVIEDEGIVVCGSNDGCLYALNIKDGILLWKTSLDGEIKHRPAFDKVSGLVVVADHGGSISAVDLQGNIVWKYKMGFGSYCIPKIDESKVYVTSFDKFVYCLEVKTGKLVWKDQTSGRIFSSAEIFDKLVIFGNNEGKVYFYDKYTGEKLGVQVVSERVTNKVALDSKGESLYVLDYVNNLYKFDLSYFKSKEDILE